MKEAFRTARPRRVAVLAAVGLALAGATIGACVDLRTHAEAARDAQIAILDLQRGVATTQTLPRTVHNRGSLAVTVANLGHRANRAELTADSAAITAVLLAAIISGLLFWRLVRSNATAASARALAESVIESSPDGIFAYDLDGRYAIWNRTTEELTGLARADVIGLLPEETPEGLIDGAHAARKVALLGDRSELRNVSVQSGGRAIDVVYAPLFDGKRRVVGGLGHVRDVTSRNKLEEELRQSQKLEAIGQLAGGIAHDFNNLLMGIGGYASLALQRVPEDDAILRHDLEEIEESTARARVLTEQLLFFARRRERRVEAVDLNAVARGATKLLRRLIEPSVAIELDLHEPAWVTGDGAQLEQVLLNLGTNARDAMPNGGVLTIRTRLAGPDQVQLLAEDTGAGIPDDVKPHVFEPFFTTKVVGHGTGLGLASAYGIVTEGGGSIEVDSAIGRGTTFTITLPASAPGVAEPLPTHTPAAHEATATILLVEDERVVRELLAAGLEEEGYTVIAKPVPSDALAYVEDGGVFDFLITDVVMPGLSGGELVERIRSAVGSSFDTIYVSGYPATGITLDERSTFLQKPFDLAELYSHVEKVLMERGEEVLGSSRGAARVAS